MSDDALRALTDEDRARLTAARKRGGTCAGCGRPLAEGEPVWWERFALGAYPGGRASYRRAPVGRECASPSRLAATEGHEPESCVGCGRPVYSAGRDRRRRVTSCSHRCAHRYWLARAKEETTP